MLRDINATWRGLLRQRGFLVTGTITIAVGIFLTATVFAIVDGVLFRPLPYRDPDSLCAIFGAARAEHQFQMPVSWPDVEAYRQAPAFISIAAFSSARSFPARVLGTAENISATVAEVSPEFFDVLGVSPAIGRTFEPAEYQRATPDVALISNSLWHRAYGGEPSALGATLTRGSDVLTVVGVLPRNFVLPVARPMYQADVLVPITTGSLHAADRQRRTFDVIARLARGHSIDEGRTQLDAIALRIKPLFVPTPNVYPGAFDGATVVPLRDHMTRFSRPALVTIFSSVVALLLLACTNVAVLLIARGGARSVEFAVRIALGAGRWRLTRLVMAESGLVAMLGGALGAIALGLTFKFVVATLPTSVFLVGQPSLTVRVVAFTLVLIVGTALAAGCVPALVFTSENRLIKLRPRLHGNRRARWFTTGLTGIEVALATILVVAGGLMVNSFVRLYAGRPGVDARQLIVFRVSPSAATKQGERETYLRRLMDRVSRLSGVQAVALNGSPLLMGGMRGSGFIPPRDGENAPLVTDVVVTPNYAATAGLRVLAGRFLTETDQDSVVMSDALARTYWPQGNAVGQTVRYGASTRVVVGIVNDVIDVSLDRRNVGELYHVWRWGDPANALPNLVVRFSSISPDHLITDMKRVAREMDDGVVVITAGTYSDLLGASVPDRNFNTLLLLVFAVAALLMAFVGIFGVVSASVSQIEREIGIRVALGAAVRHIVDAVGRPTIVAVAVGALVGIVSAALLSRVMQSFVFGITSSDVATYGAAVGVLVACAILACAMPVRRALCVDPIVALKAE